MLLYLPSLSRRCRKISHASSKQQVSTTGTDDSEVSCKQIRKGPRSRSQAYPREHRPAGAPTPTKSAVLRTKSFERGTTQVINEITTVVFAFCPSLYRLSSESSPG